MSRQTKDQGPIWKNREEDVWTKFSTALAEISTFDAAKELVEGPLRPSPSLPGRKFFSNFGFFLQSGFLIPDGASERELVLYCSFLERLDCANVKLGTLEDFKNRLKKLGYNYENDFEPNKLRNG